MYMMAAGWRVVGDIIRDLIDDGLDDAVVKSQLKDDPHLRSKFLVLYDSVNILVQAGQANFAVLASSTSAYRGLALCDATLMAVNRALWPILQENGRS